MALSSAFDRTMQISISLRPQGYGRRREQSTSIPILLAIPSLFPSWNAAGRNGAARLVRDCAMPEHNSMISVVKAAYKREDLIVPHFVLPQSYIFFIYCRTAPENSLLRSLDTGTSLPLSIYAVPFL